MPVLIKFPRLLFFFLSRASHLFCCFIHNVRIIFIYVYHILLNCLAEPETMHVSSSSVLCFVVCIDERVVDLLFREQIFNDGFWCDQSNPFSTHTIVHMHRIHRWHNSQNCNVGTEHLLYIYSIIF